MGSEEYKANGSSAFYIEMWDDIHQTKIRPHVEWAAPDEVPLRIGFCGAHGVGKTKLAKKLSLELDLPLISHVPRTVKGLGLDLNKNATINTQIAVWLGQITEQVEIYEFVTDRTLVDYLAYAKIMVDESGNEIDEFIVNALSNLTFSLFNSQYTIIFYLPPNDEYIKNNGFRSRDKSYQGQVDELIKHYLSCFNVDYFPLQGSELKRHKLAMEYLEDSGLLDREH